ncbi:MAG: NDP-hexose 2,3-dehydratase family protein [Desulfobacteraceae bacterium]|nr:NDP-hexose 2,3-dehydratase family protein [Desulfobacteraceae bacterium]
MTTDEFLSWLEKQNKKTIFNIKKVPLNKLSSWFFDKNNNLQHNSGKFFSIEGIHVKTDSGTVKEWKQPIINQPEIGILGILCQKHEGILYFLLQAKIEPGNINKIQMSPTVQATKSNYSQVHGGKLPQYLSFFINFKNKKIIVDQLQSEQGARFYKKRNRNIIIEVPEDIKIELSDNYCWLTLGQIKKLLSYNNIINMDTRTVLSCTQIKAI